MKSSESNPIVISWLSIVVSWLKQSYITSYILFKNVKFINMYNVANEIINYVLSCYNKLMKYKFVGLKLFIMHLNKL